MFEAQQIRAVSKLTVAVLKIATVTIILIIIIIGFEDSGFQDPGFCALGCGFQCIRHKTVQGVSCSSGFKVSSLAFGQGC